MLKSYHVTIPPTTDREAFTHWHDINAWCCANTPAFSWRFADINQGYQSERILVFISLDDLTLFKLTWNYS